MWKTACPPATRPNRHSQFEILENRLVFSADPLSAGLAPVAEMDSVPGWVLNDPASYSGADYVLDQYGFDGAGQTIAIVDSGIAWDHFALGGGYGPRHRVVGGWDFAEGDGLPYDDAPAGFHGTHVAGIVGSGDTAHPGIAAGADLVALRVFDDQGRGELEWVEQALQWVHDHRLQFEHPLTTVNLSLGVEWTEETMPNWAILEDEFRQLEQDGIFISVAAGNSFRTWQQTGVAYPAISQFVVPVASHGPDGLLSEFSQRNDQVLVAPGESMRSAVPDHLWGGTHAGAWLGASGTSMAAPWVAGASAVLRQAMDFMGQHQITQDDLYRVFRETADLVFDPVTQHHYHRINLAAAVDSVVTDWFGEASGAAEGSLLESTRQFAGTIGKLSDTDSLTVIAALSGRVELDFSKTGNWKPVLEIDGQKWSGGHHGFDVQAGQAYTLSVASGGGIGHWAARFRLTPHLPANELGQIDGVRETTLAVDQQQWLAVTAKRDGLMGVTGRGQSIEQLEVFDSALNRVASGLAGGPEIRAVAEVEAGGRYYLKISGSGSDATIRLNNSLSLDEGRLSISGNHANNRFGLAETADGRWVSVTVDGFNYQLQRESIDHIEIDGQTGRDYLFLETGSRPASVTLSPGQMNYENSRYGALGTSLEMIEARGNRRDTLTLLDSYRDDRLIHEAGHTLFQSANWSSRGSGFGNVVAWSRGGSDTATLTGSQAAESATLSQQRVWMKGAAVFTGSGFSHYHLDGSGGHDHLVLESGEAGDQFTLAPAYARATLGQQLATARGFETAVVTARTSGTRALLTGSPAADSLYVESATVVLAGRGWQNSVLGVEDVGVDTGPAGGFDRARIHGSAGPNVVWASPEETRISANGFRTTATGFDVVSVHAGASGGDRLTWQGSADQEIAYQRLNQLWVTSTHHRFAAHGFATTSLSGGGGDDRVTLVGGEHNNTIQGNATTVQLRGPDYEVTARDFRRVRVDGQGGQNVLALDGFGNGDGLSAGQAGVLAWLADTRIEADNLIWLEATSRDGETASREIDAVDFWYTLHGQWADARPGSGE